MQKQMTPKDFVTYSDVSIELRDVVNSNEPLQRLAQQKLEVVLSYKISRALKQLDTVIDQFSKRRSEVLNRLGKLSEDKKTYVFEGDNESIAENELETMLTEVVTIKVPTLKLEELSSVQIEPRVLALLDWYIKE